MENKFKMVAKTLKGLEAVLADELRALGAFDVEPGHRMVSFGGDLETLYQANLSCRTALRILKPFYEFEAGDPDELYDAVKAYDWGSLLTLAKTFSIDTTVYSDEFTHSRFVTYRVKDAIVDWFKDRYGEDKRPGVRLQDADVMINVHISGRKVTLSLDSSGESLHKRGWRRASTEAPISEVLAAGILLLSGYRGDRPFVDPMCGSGTFLVEAALIAANIKPGVFRQSFAFEHWPDFDADLFDRLANDDSEERPIAHPIIGRDISPAAADIARRNLTAAGVAKDVDLAVQPISAWEEAPAPEGIIVTNPPYGERISAPDMEALYETIGSKLKHVFAGWEAWIIGYREEYFRCIGLAPTTKIDLYNGSLDCQLRHYVIFAGTKRDFRAAGGRLKTIEDRADRQRRDERKAFRRDDRDDRRSFRDDRRDGRRRPFDRDDRRSFRDDRDDRRKPFSRDNRRPFRDDRDDRRGIATEGFAPESENPMARRRNIHALKSIGGAGPKLPPSTGAIMRDRGWKKRSLPPKDKGDDAAEKE